MRERDRANTGDMTETYGAPGPGAGMPQQTAGKATAALIVALIGLVVCGPIAGIIALVLASQARREINESGGRLGGEGMVKWARIIGIVDITLGVLALLAIVAILFLGSSEDTLDDLEGQSLGRTRVVAAAVSR